jgi:hypothetical protein
VQDVLGGYYLTISPNGRQFTIIFAVGKKLDLEQFFTSITISSLVLTQDYRGAKQVGIKSFWLNRFQPVGIAENQLPNLSSLR